MQLRGRTVPKGKEAAAAAPRAKSKDKVASSARERSRLRRFQELLGEEEEEDEASERDESSSVDSEHDLVRISKNDVDEIVGVLRKLRQAQNEIARDNRKLRKVLLRAFGDANGRKLEGNTHKLQLGVKKRMCVDQKKLFGNPVENHDFIQRLKRKGIIKECETKRIFIDDELEKSEATSSDESEAVSEFYNKYL